MLYLGIHTTLTGVGWGPFLRNDKYSIGRFYYDSTESGAMTMGSRFMHPSKSWSLDYSVRDSANVKNKRICPDGSYGFF